MDLVIREACGEDGAAISEIYAPYVRETPISFEEEAPGAAAMSERIRATLLQCPYLVGEIGGRVVGYAHAAQHRARASYRWSVDTSVYLDRNHTRRGIGRALYQALFPLLARQGFVTAFAGVTLPNPASVGLHESLGFKPVGVYKDVGYKHGAWHDVGWWRLPLVPPPENPTEPVAWPAMPRLEPVRLSPRVR